MKNSKLIGTEKFKKLCSLEMLGLTFEYIVYSHLKYDIPEKNQLKIAKLLEITNTKVIEY